MIIDREIVITGSFNFTKAAEENNAENLLIIKSNDL
jgi:phosphatidylserine/phosphatidylglycerophosphate/cardiolipin synthase-like enzyme